MELIDGINCNQPHSFNPRTWDDKKAQIVSTRRTLDINQVSAFGRCGSHSVAVTYQWLLIQKRTEFTRNTTESILINHPRKLVGEADLWNSSWNRLWNWSGGSADESKWRFEISSIRLEGARGKGSPVGSSTLVYWIDDFLVKSSFQIARRRKFSEPQ